MPRGRTAKIAGVKRQLRLRLEEGVFRPGDRFLSARALAERHRVSYQSAHRLLRELVEEGLLRRAPRSGTYVAGRAEGLEACELVFHPRARRAESFGARLLAELKRSLEARGLALATRFAEGPAPATTEGCFPILWEVPEAVETLVRERGQGLVLARGAPPGRASTLLDSVTIDDFSGGASAAELVRERGLGSARAVVVVGGPPEDERSNERIRGFRSVLPGARVVFACGWYYRDGLAVADEVLGAEPDAVFCCNDRLAEAIRSRQGNRVPFLVGFDDAPVAEELGLNTIAIPWREIAAAAAEVAAARIARREMKVRRQIFSPHPILREEIRIS